MNLFHPSSAALIEGGVAGVEVFGVEVILRDAEGVGETIKGEWILRYPLFYIFHLIFKLSFEASMRSIRRSTIVILSLTVNSSQCSI